MTRHDQIRCQQRLRQAEGYLEMEMPSHALKALEGLRAVGESAGRIYYLRGESLRNSAVKSPARSAVLQ